MSFSVFFVSLLFVHLYFPLLLYYVTLYPPSPWCDIFRSEVYNYESFGTYPKQNISSPILTLNFLCPVYLHTFILHRKFVEIEIFFSFGTVM